MVRSKVLSSSGAPASSDPADPRVGRAGGAKEAPLPDSALARAAAENEPHVSMQIRGLRKIYRQGRDQVVAVDDLALEVGEAELLVILGSSGSGKTTLVRCIAGLETPDHGEIVVSGRTVFSSERRVDVAPERRGLSMVFQNHALWPHMTVFANVAYPVQARRRPKDEIERKVRRALAMVGCEGLEKRHPAELSGGQQQRVALARAIVTESSVMLLDEPLSSVDAQVRDRLRLDFLALQRELRLSAVYITHDHTEATVLGDRICVMTAGSMAQVGPPRELYGRPRSSFVASFLGAANVFAGTMDMRDGREPVVRTALGEIRSTDSEDRVSGEAVVAVFRPEHCEISQSAPGLTSNCWKGQVERSLFLGHCTEYLIRVADQTLSAKIMKRVEIPEGSAVWISISADAVRLIDPM